MWASVSASSGVDVDELARLAARRAPVAGHVGVVLAATYRRGCRRAMRRTRSGGALAASSELRARHPLGHVLGHAERLGALVVECGAARHRRAGAQQLLDDPAGAGRAGGDLGGELRRPRRRARRRARPGRRGRCAPPRCRRSRRAENIIRFAVDMPTRSGRRTDMPHTGTMPHWPWVSPNVVDVGGDDQVAAEGQLQAAGEAVAADLGDRRLGELARARRSSPAWRWRDGARSPAAIAAEVVAGAERAAGTGEHDDADARRRRRSRRGGRAARRTRAGFSALSFSGRLRVKVVTPSASSRSTRLMPGSPSGRW